MAVKNTPASSFYIGGTKVSAAPAAPAPVAKPEVIAPVKAPVAKPEVIAPISGGGAQPMTPAASTPAIAADITKINTFVESLQAKLEASNVAMGLNPDGSTPAAKTLSRVEENEAKKAAGPPSVAPLGFRWSWIGTEYKLYANTPTQTLDTSPMATDKTLATDKIANVPSTPSTSVDVLKALLKAQGFSSKIVEPSATYLNSLLKDNLDYDNAIEVFLNTKDYTLKDGSKITSPFYTEYGYLNEGLPQPKEASELFNAVEGYKGLQAKYGFSEKFITSEAFKGYVKNNVTVTDLDKRANDSRLAAITTDAAKTAAFIKLGYIANDAGLQDFYMDFKIGKEQLETNRNTGAFVAEAIRRNSTGIAAGATQLTDFKKIAAELTAKGYSEAQISTAAATGFQNIGQDLAATTALAGIYQKAGGTATTNAALQESIQSELTQEEFMNMPSSRRKLLEEQNRKAFQGTAGITAGSFKTTGMV
jgi:hypothetical protein